MIPADFAIAFGTIVAIAIGLAGIFGLFLPMPYVPTPKAIAEKMVLLARMQGNENVFDLGAGDGAILIAAKRMHPDIHATGIELSPIIWLLGFVRILFSRKKIRFILGNALRTDLRNADVIFLYALPIFLEKLRPKLDAELRPGTRIISHSFPIPHKVATETMEIPWGKRHRTLYRYDW